MKRILSIFMTFCMIATLGSVTAFAATDANESISPQQESIIIGEFDGPLTDYLDPSVPMPIDVANVRINSYATYDSEDGVQVHVKLYVPWYDFPKPEFTGMAGTVTVDLNNKTTDTAFAEVADGEETIETDVNTGVKGTSGTEGTVTVSGAATALNALLGGGAFYISYEIQIP